MNGDLLLWLFSLIHTSLCRDWTAVIMGYHQENLVLENVGRNSDRLIGLPEHAFTKTSQCFDFGTLAVICRISQGLCPMALVLKKG